MNVLKGMFFKFTWNKKKPRKFIGHLKHFGAMDHYIYKLVNTFIMIPDVFYTNLQTQEDKSRCNICSKILVRSVLLSTVFRTFLPIILPFLDGFCGQSTACKAH